ncbi:MAG: glycine dehydrogenase, partial [Armatimonadota bacterium]
MPWLPHSERDRAEMLEAIGVDTVDELFAEIPDDIRESARPDLPAPLTEMELVERAHTMAAGNRTLDDLVCFAGGGIYDRFIPAIVQSVVSRPE